MRVIIFTILLGFALSCQSSDQEPLALTYSISSPNPLNESEQAILETALSDRFKEFGFPKTELEIGPEKVSVLAYFNQNRPGKKELFYKLFDSYELDFWMTYRQTDPSIAALSPELLVMDDFKSFYELPSNAYPAEVIGICTKPQRLQTIRQELSERLDSVAPNLRLYWGLVPLEGTQEIYQLFMINDQGEATGVVDEQGIDRVRTTPHADLGRLVMEGTMNQKAATIWGEMTSHAANDNNRCVAIVWNERLLSAPRVMEPILSGAFMIMSDFTDAEQEEIVEAIKIGRLPYLLKLETEGGHD